MTGTTPRIHRRCGLLVMLVALWLGPNVPLAAQATATRVAYVDMQRVINESELFRAGRERLTAEFAVRTEAFNLEAARLGELEQRRDREGGSLAASELVELRRQIDTLERSLQRRRNDMNQALNQRNRELLQDIDQRIREEIAAFARAEGYDLVLTEGVGFAHPRLDVTERVLQRINTPRAEGLRP